MPDQVGNHPIIRNPQDLGAPVRSVFLLAHDGFQVGRDREVADGQVGPT